MLAADVRTRGSQAEHAGGWFAFYHTRLAFVAFAVVEMIALVFYMVLGRRMWFWGDEWDFLAARTAGDLGDLFRPHGNVHPSALPILVYRAMWNIWGLNTYRPYQLLIVVAHLVCALLVRTAMRRAGVRPWTATVVASVFVLFGAGSENILWPFQIGFVGAVAFGLAQLLLADHDGPFDRRDGLGLVAGLAAMLCSSVGVAMVAAVGVATLMRRGWRIALIHTVPLGLLFVLWWATLARPSYDQARQANPTTPDLTLRFVLGTIANTFRALGQAPGVSVLLGVVLVFGLVIAWAPLTRLELRSRASVPVALIVGAIAFVVLTGFGRAGPGASEKGRYQYVVAALILPAVAVAADALIRRWVLLAPVVLTAILVGIPGNLRDVLHYADESQSPLFRRTQLTLPRMSLAQQVPRSYIPQTGPQYYYVTIGWLLDGVASGRIPAPRLITPAEAATDNLRLSLSRYVYSPFVEQPDTCVALHGGGSPPEIELRLDKGQKISVNHALVRMVPATGPADPAFPLVLDGTKSQATIFVIRDGTELHVRPQSVAPTAQVCAPRSAFTDPTVLTTPSMHRNPDTPTFCAIAADIQDFLARLPFDRTKNPRPKTIRQIPTVLLPLLTKAQQSAPSEVAEATDTFTQAVRTRILTGTNPFQQSAVDDAVRAINNFVMTNCGHPDANISGPD